MKLNKGDKAIEVILPSIEGNSYDTSILKGKPYMLSFFRFASCPFCNMRVHQLVKKYHEFGEDFTIVAVFDSPIENLISHATDHNAPFPILADQNNKYYEAYSIERSFAGVLKGMILRFPTLMKGIIKGYLPLKIKGSMTTMPADFLIDRKGMIRKSYYGKDEGDHLSIDEVIKFSRESIT